MTTKSSKLVAATYNTAYKLGLAPWDNGPPMDELIETLKEFTPGRAIDLGCGTGRDSVYMAQQGWRVTGVDLSPEAIKKARKRAEASGVEVDFVQYDLLNLPSGGIEGGFDFLLDFGCSHSLRDEAKGPYAAAVAELAKPGATLYLYAFTKGPLSVRREEIDTCFTPYWELVSAVPGSVRRTPDAGPIWYRMVRRS
ncbi:class I SAM-dependent methyltransferase [Nonomuraea sp. NPDC046802]|uniref:class I SAM-dependent methyltransferase n=1 Tax=Nonomuraea sp. NPDC046802 TaxID=3154919 RepID=UPI0033EF4184